MPSSSEEEEGNLAGVVIINVLTYVFLCTVMFGIGAGVRLSDLRTVLHQRKAALSVGMASQYFVVPAMARFVSTILLDMPDIHAFTVVLIACCPGGAMSNALTYFAKGDLALSVAMTAVSNVLAFGTVPLLLLAWTQGFNGMAASTPFLDILYSTLMVLVPVSLGIAVRAKNNRWGEIVERCGAIGGALLIGVSVVVGFASNAKVLGDATLLPFKNILAVLLVAPMGMLFALSALCLLRLWQRAQEMKLAKCRCRVAHQENHVDEHDQNNRQAHADRSRSNILQAPACATIMIETGVQNTVLAMAIVTLSCSSRSCGTSEYMQMQLIILMWGLFVTIEALFVVAICRCISSQ